MTPEHLHLALNHIPFLGSILALVPILVGLIARNKTTLLTGLALAAVTGWMTPFVMETGEQSYERYEYSSVRDYLDPHFEDSLHVHEERAHDWSKVLYASAVVSSLALVLLLWKPKAGQIASILATILCLAAFLSGIWIAESGGKIRRPDFRETSPPAGLTEAYSEEDSEEE